MLKKDLETRRISRIGSLIVPHPRRADGANAFSHPRLVCRAARAYSLNTNRRRRAISRKPRLADAPNWDFTFRNRPSALFPNLVIHRSGHELRTQGGHSKSMILS